MNNDQFRRLVNTNTSGSSTNASNAASSGAKPTVAAALGSRLKSSIPMTPRSLGINTQTLFAKQLAERDQAEHPQKRLRTSAPKGSKLAQGYVDRAKIRQAQEEAEARSAKLRALEQAFESGEIDEATYRRRREEVGDTKLPSNVPSKGLDFELLAKARKGESGPEEESPEEGLKDDAAPDTAVGDDVDDALEQLEGAEVQAVTREKTQKKGQLATKAVGPSGRRTRDQLLAELKASREAAKAKEKSALGNKFKKIGSQKTPGTRIERDRKGREVMIIVDEDGHEKRKVRKMDKDDAPTEKPASIPEKKTEVLGMEVPEFYRKRQMELEAKKREEDNDDIFADVGEYNPLAGMDSDSDDDSSEEGETASDDGSSRKRGIEDISGDGTGADSKASGPAPAPKMPEAPPVAPKNYFQHSKTGLISEESRKITAANDPAVLAALRKAKALNAEAKSEEEKQAAEREARLKKMLQDSNRDTEDLDMGFGTNRLEDEADMEERDVKLAVWGDEGDEGQGGGGKAKRKRGGKKRKGDVNSAADVLQVLEHRKAADS
ncbi:hypothetical protein MAPG_06633 [Magnaporthiopsis poae ATCC 64411]|uniref:RED-like N-terminal domain-containing protein n=1 Tax=Magnaporthiopsis poae (strain ATCC 64411 / 73-15) TaxID=644358 RepID=A0A0C4E2J5_MAGP6|nr:hypothetical protein MAPG_06633 [Magnaporthiopsis poae ATCC 64411]